MTSHEAFQIGLADRVYPQEDLMSKTVEFLEELAKKDRKIVVRIKTLIDGMTGLDVDSAAELETDYTDEWLRECKE